MWQCASGLHPSRGVFYLAKAQIVSVIFRKKLAGGGTKGARGTWVHQKQVPWSRASPKTQTHCASLPGTGTRGRQMFTSNINPSFEAW